MSLRAAEFVGILAEEASEKELTVGGMGKDGMSLDQAQGANGLLAGAGEAFDGLQCSRVVPIVATACLGSQLVGADAGAYRIRKM